MKSFVYVAVGALLGIVLVFIGWRTLGQNYRYQGSLIDPPVKAIDFELTDQKGAPFRLSDQTGKIVLVFFGYTHCPDVCPITLSEYMRIKESLGDLAENVSFVFITIDPERDTPDRLGEHLQIFDPEFVGLTGEAEQLAQVWKDYGVYIERRETEGASGYLLDHNPIIYAIDRQGNWRLTYPFGMETEKIVQDITHLLQEQ
jgi:protein SCO1/2